MPPDAAGDAEAEALAAADGDAAVGVAFESDAHDVTSSDAAMKRATSERVCVVVPPERVQHRSLDGAVVSTGDLPGLSPVYRLVASQVRIASEAAVVTSSIDPAASTMAPTSSGSSSSSVSSCDSSRLTGMKWPFRAVMRAARVEKSARQQAEPHGLKITGAYVEANNFVFLLPDENVFACKRLADVAGGAGDLQRIRTALCFSFQKMILVALFETNH